MKQIPNPRTIIEVAIKKSRENTCPRREAKKLFTKQITKNFKKQKINPKQNKQTTIKFKHRKNKNLFTFFY
jgi:hypothetical protein